MFRRTSRLVGLAVAVLAATATAHGQGPMLMLPIQDQVPEVPNIDGPVQRLPLGEPPNIRFVVPISPNTGMPTMPGQTDNKRSPLAELAALSNDYVDPRYIANSQRPDDPGIWERTRDGYKESLHHLCSDYKRFYWSENLVYVGVAIGIAAPMANTQFDQRIRDEIGRAHV